MFDQLSKPKSKFPLILAGSITLHGALVGMLFVSWVWGIALEFGELRFEAGGESTVKVAMLDRSKPLFMPPGFYAITKPPEDVAKPVDRDKDGKKQPKDDDVQKKSDDDDQKKSEDPKPTGSPGFGTLRGGALKPHIQQVYEAHERGLISVDNFVVTVSCRALADGTLADIRVTRSSGDELIDQTAVNLIKEIGNQKALAPLSILSSLSLTLEKDAAVTKLAAVGFSDDPGTCASMATRLGIAKFGARIEIMRKQNADQLLLVDSVQISQSGNRLTVSASLPNSRAGEMMQRSFGSTAKAGG